MGTLTKNEEKKNINATITQWVVVETIRGLV